MKHILKLYIMLQKNNRSNEGDGSKVDSTKLIMYFIGGIAALLLGLFANKFAGPISTLGGVNIIVPLIGALVTLGTIGLGFTVLLNQMYMSSDIEVLITLPFSAMQIVILRVCSLFQNTFLASVALILVPCIGYAGVYPLSVYEWCGVIVIAILLPVFVTAVLATVIILLMSILKFFQSRETLRIIGAILLFFGICLYYYYLSGDKNIVIEDLLVKFSAIVGTIKCVIPVIGFGLGFIEKGSLLYLLYELLCVVISVLILVIVAKSMYLRGAMNMQDAKRGKMLSNAEVEKYCTKKPVLKALMSKEFRLVRRNPVYMLHNFIIGALWPVLAVIAFKQFISSISEDMNGGLLDILCGPVSLNGFALGTTMLTIFGLAIVSLPLTMQTIAVSSLSREGQSFIIMKQIPVPYDVQIEAKRRVARNIAQVSVTVYSAIIMLVTSIITGFSFIYCIIPIIMIALYTELHVNAGVSSGIKNVNINWDDEKVVTKKSTPFIVFCVGALMVFLILSMMVAPIFASKIIPYTAGLVAVFIVAIVLFIANNKCRRYIKKNGELKIRRLRF